MIAERASEHSQRGNKGDRRMAAQGGRAKQFQNAQGDSAVSGIRGSRCER